ncbi:MAG: Rieske (2Fe-2S) protein [Deltaproteobacteria bacterium]
MKRSGELVVISRRTFVTLAGAGGLGIVVACNSTPSSTIDAPPSSTDAPTGGGCSTAGIDVGAASTYMMNVPVLTKRLVIVRDGGGLYAMSAACTHEGQPVCIGTTTSCTSSGTDLYCTRHGAAFTFTGAVVRGPANTPLPHYAMCTLANGNLGVLTTMVVPATTRFQA